MYTEVKMKCEFLRERVTKIINSEKKKRKLLTEKQRQLYENAKICYICQEKFEKKYLKDEKCYKVSNHCHYTGKYRGAAHSICSLKYSVTKKFLWFFKMDLIVIIIFSLKI